MIFLNSYDKLKKQLALSKTAEILNKIKKPYQFTIQELEKGAKKEVERVELVEDGTIRMYVKNAKEPIRMYPDMNTVWIIAYYKRLFRLMAENLIRMGWIKRIIALLAIKFNFNIFSEWLAYIFSMFPVLLNDNNYSQPIKEIRRVLKGKLDQNMLDGLALILEYDSYYRYIFQDTMMELKKENLNKPAKEIKRLLDIISIRETKALKIAKGSKWQKCKRLMILLFIFCPKIKRQIVSILREINIDEVKFSKEDNYWINENMGYQFKGLTIEQRKAENLKNYGE